MREGTLIALFVLGILAMVPSAYAVRAALAGRLPDPRVVREGGTVLFGLWLMEAFHWAMRWLGRGLVRTGLSPDTLTLTSLVLTLACLPFAALGQFALAGVLLLSGAAFDAFDGIVARERRMASEAGEVLDAIVDRYADAAPLVGLAIFYRDSAWQMLVPLVALVGSMMVSYARAKAEALSIELPSGLMRRHERIAYIAGALLIGPMLSPWIPIPSVKEPAILAVLGLVGIVSNFVAGKLTREARRELVANGRGPQGESCAAASQRGEP